MLALHHSDYEIIPIVTKMYAHLLAPDGEKYVKSKLIMPRHLHDANVYPSTADHDPKQQQDKSASP